MSQTITLEHLSAEHRCLMTVAEEIERQLTELRAEAHTDFASLHERVVFLREHFVNAHLPKDRAVVAELVKHLADEARRVLSTFLNSDGIELMEHIEAFEENLKGVVCERMVARDELLRRGEATVHSLRAQIRLEESATLPWARTQLDEGAWERLDGDVKVITSRWRGNGCAGAA